jgi:hypothetical protein
VRFRALVITILFAAGVAASVAVAKGPPPGKGKGKKQHTAAASTAGSTSTSTVACKPKVAVVLKGDFVSGSGSDDEGVFQMKVRQANRHGKQFVAETVTIAYDEKTKFMRRGHAELDDFEAGDWLNVQARACKQQKPKKPKRGSTTGSTSTATTTAPSTSGTTSTGAGGSSAELLAKRVTGKPGTVSTGTGTTTVP